MRTCMNKHCAARMIYCFSSLDFQSLLAFDWAASIEHLEEGSVSLQRHAFQLLDRGTLRNNRSNSHQCRKKTMDSFYFRSMWNLFGEQSNFMLLVHPLLIYWTHFYLLVHAICLIPKYSGSRSLFDFLERVVVFLFAAVVSDWLWLTQQQWQG